LRRDAPLRVALVASPWYQVPPPAYGGIEALVYWLAEGLLARGHQVTVIGAGECGTALASCGPTRRHPPAGWARRCRSCCTPPRPASCWTTSTSRWSTTIRWPGRWPPPGTRHQRCWRLGLPLVAISEFQRRQAAPDLPWVGRVHNAIPVATFPYRQDKGDVWVGEADANHKRDLLSRARCLLFPVRWDEPFGLVMVEAMACGTPVVALRAGSVPEVVDQGVTGWICRQPAELARGIAEADRLDPADCRQRAERLFDVAGMVDGYERVYRQVAGCARHRDPDLHLATAAGGAPERVAPGLPDPNLGLLLTPGAPQPGSTARRPKPPIPQTRGVGGPR
jgi:Glycosyl transferases group 1